LEASRLRSLFFPAQSGKKRVLQSVSITHIRQDARSAILQEQSKVRGMSVKGMGKSVFRIIPLTIIPLTSLRPFPSSIFALVAAGRAVFLWGMKATRIRG
jgi:hypothetical protein